MKLKGKLALVLIVILLLIGCGKEETKLEETAELTQDVVEETETVGEENVEVPETDQAEEESEEEEKATKEQEETTNEMPEAQIVATVADIYAFLDYSETLENPAILVYNEKEGYIINMGEGEYYQLKSGDRIFEFWSDRVITARTNLHMLEETSMRGTLYESIIEYSESDELPLETVLVVFFTEDEYEGEYFHLTCYLSPPTE